MDLCNGAGEGRGISISQVGMRKRNEERGVRKEERGKWREE